MPRNIVLMGFKNDKQETRLGKRDLHIHVYAFHMPLLKTQWGSNAPLPLGPLGYGTPLPIHISLVVRKPVFGVSDQVPHKPGCTVTEDGWRLEILDLGSRGIVLSV